MYKLSVLSILNCVRLNETLYEWLDFQSSTKHGKNIKLKRKNLIYFKRSKMALHSKFLAHALSNSILAHKLELKFFLI